MSTPISTLPHQPAGATGGDPDDVRLVADCPPELAPFNEAGVLHPADVHTARMLCGLTGCAEPAVALATALAVRGPRVGHVCVDLATVHRTVTDVDDDPDAVRRLPWPEDPAAWIEEVARAEALVARPGEGGPPRPLTLDGSRLYLDRYWRYERQVGEVLRTRAARTVTGVDTGALRRGLDRLFGPVDRQGPDLQRLAAATAVTRALTVVAGGPGTGKTTTVARILALLDEQATALGAAPPRVALAAPTGKAAARLEESLREALERDELDPGVRERLAGAEASTIHRLLRRHPGSSSRFRHDAGEPLPHDVVIVDEASMVSLALMAKLIDALPEQTRLVLVGDPQQLRSVEAGAVLGDIVGPALRGLRLSAPARRALQETTGEDLDGIGEVTEPGIGDGIVVLQRMHRFGETSGIADLAAAIQSGDGDRVMAVLRAGHPDVAWQEREPDATDESGTDLSTVRGEVTAVARRSRDAAAEGDADGALAALDEARVLCAHRRGPFGVSTWVPRVESWLGGDAAGARGGWPVGRPVLITRNDHQLRIYNGDVGVVVATDDGPRVAFPSPEGPRLIPPSRLDAAETVHAMTIHKSQGSQFHHAVVVLPTATSLILSRELLYTGVTRAQDRVTLIGSEETVRAGVARVVHRASGLRARLWPDDPVVPDPSGGPDSVAPSPAAHDEADAEAGADESGGPERPRMVQSTIYDL